MFGIDEQNRLETVSGNFVRVIISLTSFLASNIILSNIF
jgi:hypothetical protein